MLPDTNSERNASSRKIWLCACPGLLLAVLFLLPYLTKAYTIDDPFFLQEAQQVLKTPLRPMHFEMCWFGGDQCGPVTHLGPSAALMGYALVPAILGGGAEWIGHLIQMALASASVLAMVALALRIGYSSRNAMFAGLLLVATPPFLSMANTVMPDTLALCLGLWGIERLLAWKADPRLHRAAIASIALGLAPYARLHLVVLFPVGALLLLDGTDPSAWLRQIRQSPVLWAPLAIGMAVTAGVYLVTREPGNSVAPPAYLISLSNVRRNLTAYLGYLSIPIPFAIPRLLVKGRKSPWLLIAAPVGLFLFLIVRHLAGPNSQESLAGTWPAFAIPFSAAALAHLWWESLRQRSPRHLALAVWILGPLVAVVYVHLPIKYLLAVAPAVIVLLLDYARSLSYRAALAGALVLVIGGITYSSLLLTTDARFAEMSRTASRELIAPHVAAGEKVWSAGQWGFYWYAARAGANVLVPGISIAKPGDLLAVGYVEGGASVLKFFPKRSLLQSYSESCTCGRTVGENGGLYTTTSSYALWSWDTGEIARYELWRID